MKWVCLRPRRQKATGSLVQGGKLTEFSHEPVRGGRGRKVYLCVLIGTGQLYRSTIQWEKRKSTKYTSSLANLKVVLSLNQIYMYMSRGDALLS
jgi:hypothetical protein